MCAGTPCGREAVLTARLFRVGDRSLCRPCFDTYVALGMDIRELAAETVVPAWRQRSLARDDTGRVLGGSRLSVRGAA